ncbi:hypothetical protein KK113_16505, partial [Enterobacter hormaechei subsp. hoffmannii]|nr:hypothetical protein [Enterobacter hormaechei subsp. hoffmannii]
FTTSRRFSKGYFGFDISGTIPFHRPTKWVQYTISFFDVGLSTVCLLRKPEANSLKHPSRTLCAFSAPVRKSFHFVKPPSRIKRL